MNNERTIIHVPAYEDLIDRVAHFESFTITGRVYSAELLTPQLTIDSKDLIAEAASCGAFVLYWGIEAARARRFKEQVDSSYRMWRDRTWLEVKATSIGQTAKGEPKFPSDGQTEKVYRTMPDYGTWHQRLQTAQESAEMAEAIHEAFKMKARLIETQERLLRDQAAGPYIVSENMRQTIPRQPRLSS